MMATSPGGGYMTVGIQATGIFKMGTSHPQFSGLFIHHGYKSRLAAAHILGHGHGSVVGAGNTDGLEHIVEGHLLPRFQPDLAAAHTAGVFADGDHILAGDAALLHRFKGQEQRHHLGDGRNGPPLRSVFLIQDRAGILVDQDRRGTGHIQFRHPRQNDPLLRRFRQNARQRDRQQKQAQKHRQSTFFHGNSTSAENWLCLRLCGGPLL